MAIARINGPMLNSNLERQGVNLTIDANLMYYDVTSRFVGINNTSPAYALDSTGNARIANLYVLGNTISSNSGVVGFGSISNISINGGSNNYIISTNGVGTLSFINANTLPVILSLVSNATSQQTQINSIVTTANANTAAYLSSNTFTGNIATQGNISTTANVSAATVSATYFYGNAWYVTGFPYGNVQVASFMTNFGSNTITTTGNVTAPTVGIHYGNVFVDTIAPYQTNVTVFNSTTAVGLPAGNTAQRPGGANGYLRYNSDNGTLEYYAGSWVSITNNISGQIITPNGTSQSYTLDRATSAAGIIVSINGTVQQPSVSYTVSGTTITFAEIPATTDIIDVRFIASAAVSTTLDITVVDTANVTVGTTATIVDSMDATLYRSAKYTISSTNSADAQFSQLMLTQNAGTVAIGNIANVRVGTSAVTYTANVNGSTVYLLATGTTSSNKLRVEKTYFIV